MGPRTWSERLGHAEVLDTPADQLHARLQRLRGTRLWQALRGRWLGHPLHPLLTDVPIGLWTGAVSLDWAGGRRMATGADTLIGLGAVAALPTAAAGMADWTEASARVRRQGLVHATANTVALATFLVSLAVRPVDRRQGRRLALAAYATLLVGGYLGGHLTYVEGVGVESRAADEPAGSPLRGTASV